MDSEDARFPPPAALPESLLARSYLRNKSGLRLSDFHVLKTIGTGSSSTVKLVTLSDSSLKIPFALKLVSKAEVVRSRHSAQLKEERRLVERMQHPFIVDFVRSFQDETRVAFVFEFVNGGELFGLLESMGSLPVPWARFYLAETLSALRYLHSRKVVFRDLKAENILLSHSGHVKLVDFGYAKELEGTRAHTLCGTPEYMAPEMLLKGKIGYGCSVDIWALGVLAFELLTG